MLNEVEAMKLMIKFLDAGVVPMGYGGGGVASLHFDMNKILAEMDPREARKMKRKFRKLWRGIVRRRLGHGGREGRSAAKRTGAGVEVPTRSHKSERKRIVYWGLNRREAIVRNS